MSRATKALCVALVGCAALAVIAGWVCLGIWLATTGRDGWMFVYSGVCLFAVSYVTVSVFEGEAP